MSYIITEPDNTDDILTDKQDILAKLCLFDDDFMSIVFEKNIEATECLIRTILGRDDIQIVMSRGQIVLKGPHIKGRKIQLDIFAKDSSGNLYNLEVQRANQGARPRRARYHDSAIGSRMLRKKQPFSAAKESYVIFITEHDVLHEGLPIYHINRQIEETNHRFNDGSHIIYVNGAYEDTSTPLGQLIHDFHCTNPDDMLNEVLRESVRYYKENEGGKEVMCKLIEDYVEQRALKVKEETTRIVKEETTRTVKAETTVSAIKCLVSKLGISIDEAMNILDISLAERPSLLSALE